MSQRATRSESPGNHGRQLTLVTVNRSARRSTQSENATATETTRLTSTFAALADSARSSIVVLSWLPNVARSVCVLVLKLDLLREFLLLHRRSTLLDRLARLSLLPAGSRSATARTRRGCICVGRIGLSGIGSGDVRSGFVSILIDGGRSGDGSGSARWNSTSMRCNSLLLRRR